MTNLDSVFKSRDITLPTEVCTAKAMVFPAAMYGCEDWTIKKAELQRINAFELWCWRESLGLQEVETQSILKKITPDGACSHEIKRCLFLERKIMTNLESILKSRGPSGQSYGFPNNHVWMWELDHKESWTPKNWCFWTVVLEKTLESPFDCQEIQPVPLKEN